MADKTGGAQPPLFSEQAERSIIGATLTNQAIFWDSFGKLKAEHFQVPRLARIWDAMCRIGEAGKPVVRNYVPMFIRNDGNETTPLGVFLATLINDAPPASEAEAYLETIIHLSNKRSLLESIERAKSEILNIDVGTPVEHMVDVGIQALSMSVEMDYDRDMRTYADWGRVVHERAKSIFNQGEHGVGAGLGCGLRAVQEVIGRLMPGKLYVLAGMSGGGKSALARQIIEAASLDGASQGLGQAYIASLEMPGEEYATRALSEQMGVESYKIEQGDLNEAELDALAYQVEKLKRLPIVIDQRPRLSMDNVRSRMLRLKNRGGLSIGAIDHVLLVKGGPKESLSDRIAAVTIEAKNVAKELNVPMLMLAQLNEKNILERPSGWPNFSDIFGGQTIKQNADAVLFVHRPEIVTQAREPNSSDEDKHDKWKSKMDSQRGVGWAFAEKRRGGKSMEKREMIFHGPTMTFRDM